MGVISATRVLGDINSHWVEARCRNRQAIRVGVPSCSERGNGLGRMLGRYTTDCLVPGGAIELKCPNCNQITVIRSS